MIFSRIFSRACNRPLAETYSITSPPDTLCLLRLSALGDITHVLPALRTLQNHWPNTKITWIIGKTEYQLVKSIKDVQFIVFDKSAGLSAYLDLRKQIKQLVESGAFDILLHMQLSIRASMISLLIPATIKLGFDRARAKDMQSLFCTQQIMPQSTRQHVVDSFLEFPLFFGLGPVKSWQLPVSASALDSVKSKLQSDRKIFVINPCAVAKSRNWRNWTTEGYAAIADYVSDIQNMQVVLTGGNSLLEKSTVDEIMRLCKSARPVNLVAQTSIDELVAVLHLAEIVLAPDTGPVHIASALGTKTIGLYAATNPERAGPYNHLNYVVNKYPEALLLYNKQTVKQARWGARVRTADCMKLITVADVIQQIERII
jgi:heptosyltransferase I